MTTHNHPALQIDANKDLTQLHYLHFPVRAHRYVCLQGDATLAALMRHPDWLAEVKGDVDKVFVLGEGSNTLLASSSINKWIISYQNRTFEIIHDGEHEVEVAVGAGMRWDDLVAYCVAKGWGGLACLSLIPGTVGGAVVQNIGAYGAELSETFVSCVTMDWVTGETKKWSPAEAKLTYRSSAFKKQSRYLVTHLTLRLSKGVPDQVRYPALCEVLKGHLKGDAGDLQTIRDAVIALRQSKLPDPVRFPNVGSFFKNPVLSHAQDEQIKARRPDCVTWSQPGGVKYSAAWLIEAAGLKGYRLGGVGVAEQHALILVHHGGALPEKMLDLVVHVQRCVMQRFGVMLEPEVQIIR